MHYRNMIMFIHMRGLHEIYLTSAHIDAAVVRAEFGNRQQATGNRQQATGNRQQATGNYEHLTGFVNHLIAYFFSLHGYLRAKHSTVVLCSSGFAININAGAVLQYGALLSLIQSRKACIYSPVGGSLALKGGNLQQYCPP